MSPEPRNRPAAIEEGQPVFIGGIEWGLITFMNVGQALSVDIVPLTRTGVAVVDLLGRPDERIILRRIADELPPQSCSKILLGRKKGVAGLAEPIEQLFPKPIVTVMAPIGGASPFSS